MEHISEASIFSVEPRKRFCIFLLLTHMYFWKIWRLLGKEYNFFKENLVFLSPLVLD